MEIILDGHLVTMQKFVTERERESSNQPAVASPQLWRGTRFSCTSSRLAAPKRRRVAERKKLRRRQARGAEVNVTLGRLESF
jgi:hypothetical protein